MKHAHSHIDAVETVLRTRFERQIRAHQVMPAEAAACLPFPDGLDPRLAAVLRERGIDQLYATRPKPLNRSRPDVTPCWSRARHRAKPWPSCCRS
ncbi:MAG TPA: hypothetical protein PL176_05550 [Kiritimatiellia bacterium]|nr:hypothetical protein [Kiritimatiellia bacterium]